jgi:menaquinone-dependent protoporphyrinogen oxidase
MTSQPAPAGRAILVTYASRGGSTAGVAEAIGRTLAEHGLEVDVRPMDAVSDLAPYRAVVAGSAVRRERWLPEALRFMQRHQAELAHTPCATFLVCMALATTDPRRHQRAQRTAAAWLGPVRGLISPVSEGLFAGALDVSRIRERRYRLLFRLAIALGFWAEGDYRDWAAIRAWAEGLPERLQA